VQTLSVFLSSSRRRRRRRRRHCNGSSMGFG